MKNVKECLVELMKTHENLKDFSADTTSAQAYAIVIRSEIEKLMEVIKNDGEVCFD